MHKTAISFCICLFLHFFAAGSNPVLNYGTYFGGKGLDGASAICTDKSGNVYITGTTTSASGIATKGAYQTNYGGGLNEDIFVAKFNSKGSLIWSTYFGGNGNDVASGIKVDSSENIYVAGSTTSSGLATVGSYQTNIQGVSDVFLVKFNNNGGLVWCTYYGGGGKENATCIAFDGHNNIYISGSTNSSSGIATSGTFQTSIGSSSSDDAFLAKFSSNGKLLWGTYFGGSAEDYATGITVDKNKMVYLVGMTLSSGLATSGTYQTNLSGNYDGFIAAFDTTGVAKWATYFGGTDLDWLTSVCNDNTGNIIIGGYTQSKKGIATSGAYQTGPAMTHSAYLAKFNGKGSLIWSTYYGLAADNGNSVFTDTADNIYFAGITTTGTHTMATCGAWQYSFAGSAYSDAFLAKFSPSGSRLWATYYGGDNVDAGNGVCVDKSGNIYLAGTTRSTSGIATSGAYQTAFQGDSDVFLVKFSQRVTDAALVSVPAPPANVCPGKQEVKVKLQNQGSFTLDSLDIHLLLNGKAQKTVHWKGALKPDSSEIVSLGSFNVRSGVLIIKAWTAMPNGVKDSTPCNDTIVQSITVYSPPDPLLNTTYNICLKGKASLGKTAVTGYSYAWTSNPSGFSSTLSNPSVSPSVKTIYYLTEKDLSTGCVFNDTDTVKVNPLPAPNAGPDQSICEDDSVTLGTAGISGHSYSWSLPIFGYVSSDPVLVISPNSSTLFYLKETISATGCSNTDTVKVTVNPLPMVNIDSPQTVCSGTSVHLGNTAVAVYTYQWHSQPSGFSAASASVTVKPVSNTIYYLKETITKTGCSAEDSVQINVNPIPKPDAGKDQSICKGGTAKLGYSGTPGDSYAWSSMPAGYSSTSLNISDSPSATTVYTLTETIPATGCKDSSKVTVTVHPLPAAPVITGKSEICQGDSVQSYQTGFDSASTWVWQVTGGRILSGQGSNVVVQAAVQASGLIAVKESSGSGCPSPLTIKTITVSNGPDARFTELADSPAYVFRAPDTARKKYEWSFGDGTNGSGFKVSHNYSYLKDTTVKVSLRVTDIEGCSNQYDSLIRFRILQYPYFDIGLYPNPFTQVFTLKISLEKNALVQVAAFDALGRQVGSTISVFQNTGTRTYTIDALQHAAKGFYLIKTRVDKTVYENKVIKN